MAQLRFLVRNQTIKRKDKFKVVARSKNYLYAKFEFSGDWTGEITAQFRNEQDGDNPPYEKILDENGECEVPWETLQYDNSKIYVTAFCGDLITANAEVVYVNESGYSAEGESSQDPTPGVYAQILARLGKVEYLSVGAETLPAGSEATVDKAVDPETGGYIFDFGIPKGDKGYSPEITISDIQGGHAITITDETGSQTFNIMDGQEGNDGISPECVITDIVGGHRVTITDKTGDHAFDVMDGNDYVLTQQDKEDIAALVDVPGADFHICASGEYDPVTRVPTIQDPETNVFYLVPAEDGSFPDMFVEWIYANNAWEMFGSATIDLSNYATKTDLNGKVDKVTGKGLSTNDFTNAEKNKLTGIEAGANKTVVDDELDEESENSVQNKVIAGAIKAKADLTDLAPAYDSTATYAVGDYVTYNGNIYRCTTAITTAEAWAAAHWTQVAIGAELTRYNEDITDLETALDGKVDDVQIAGTSITNQGVANVPLMDNNTFGVAKTSSSRGTYIDANGNITINRAYTPDVRNGANAFVPIVPINQHEAVFYGLTKVAGENMASSSNPVGTYTDAAKIAIQKILGIYEPPWELIREDIVTNVTDAPINITVDENGQPFELTDIRILFQTPVQETQAIVGQYGRTNFYYSPNSYDCMYLGAYTQNANAPAHTGMFSIEQRDGMIEKTMVKNAQDNGEYGIRVGNNFGKTNINGRWVLVSPQRVYTKIVLDSLTGTIQYRLYGKRKWS